MGQIEEARASCLDTLTYHRELLVSRLRSVQCILDNLLACGFVCEEDVEIVQRTVTKPEQAGKHIYNTLSYLSVKYPKIKSKVCEISPTQTFFPAIVF